MTRIWSVVLGVGLSFAGSSTAWAVTVNCDSPLGQCQLSNDGQDFAECTCEDAVSGGIAGGDAWAGLSAEELSAECDAFLESWCAPDPPYACSDSTGACIVDTEPDSYACECTDGSAPSGGGGNAWTGLTDDELAQVCDEQLDQCPPVAPKNGVLCQDDLGWCTVSTNPDFFECFCEDGQEFGGGSKGMYEGYTDDQLMAACEQELEWCGEPGAETGIGDSADGPGDDGPGDDGPGDDGPGDDDDDDDGPGDDGPGDDDDDDDDDGPGDDGPGDDDDDDADDDGTADDGPDPFPGSGPGPGPGPGDAGDTDGSGDTDGTSAGQIPTTGGCSIGGPALPGPAGLGLLILGLAVRRRRR